MKALPVVIASVLLVVACKKREENAVEPQPTSSHLRLVEMTDSASGKNKAYEKYHYDAAGRVIYIETLGGSIMYDYREGKLAQLFVYGDTLHDNVSAQMARNAQGLITSISYQYDNSSDRIELEYDLQGNLIKSKELYAMSPTSYTVPVETFYSSFENGRWTKSTTSRALVFHEYAGKYQTETRRTFDPEGRLITEKVYGKAFKVDTVDGVEQLTLLSQDSALSCSFEYFDLSEGERTQRAARKQAIENFYSKNLDAYSFLKDKPVQLDYVCKTLDRGPIYYNRNTTVIQTNAQGLITETWTKDGSVGTSLRGSSSLGVTINPDSFITIQSLYGPTSMDESRKKFRYETVSE